MVERVSRNLDEALKNTALLATPEGAKQYHSDFFNKLLGFRIEWDRETVLRTLRGEHKLPGNHHLMPNRENSGQLSGFLVYLPDIMDPRLIIEKRINDHPDPKDIQEADFRRRMSDHNSGEGAILWDARHITRNNLLWGNIYDDTTIAEANRLTGRNEPAYGRALQPLFEPLQRDKHGHTIPYGNKTLTACAIPLWKKGAACYVIKATVFDYGVGRVARFNSEGLSALGSLEEVNGLAEEDYFCPEKKIAVMKEKYRFNHDERYLEMYDRHPISPKQLDIRPLYLDERVREMPVVYRTAGAYAD